MNRLIVDSSVAVKWFLPEDGSEKASSLFDEEELFCVPKLFFLEIDAVLTKKVRMGNLRAEAVTEISKMLDGISFQEIEYSLVRRLAMDISTSLPVALYDAIYLATAVHQDGTVVTADKRLYRGLSNTHLEEVITLL